VPVVAIDSGPDARRVFAQRSDGMLEVTECWGYDEGAACGADVEPRVADVPTRAVIP